MRSFSSGIVEGDLARRGVISFQAGDSVRAPQDFPAYHGSENGHLHASRLFTPVSFSVRTRHSDSLLLDAAECGVELIDEFLVVRALTSLCRRTIRPSP